MNFIRSRELHRPTLRLCVTLFTALWLLGMGLSEADAIPLANAQATAFGATLNAAIKAAKDAAGIRSAISAGANAQIKSVGPDAAGSIASVVLASAEPAGASGADIGTPLADVAVALAGSDQNNAAAIAATLADEGTPEEIEAFSTAVTALGHPELALIARRRARPISEIPEGAGAGNGFAGGGPGGGSCLNPSCTSL